MIKPGQLIAVKYDNRTCDHYRDLGYDVSKDKPLIYVKPEHLSKGCHKRITLICDNCSREYTAQFCNYVKTHRDDIGDFCENCSHDKCQIVCMEKYGVPEVRMNKEVCQQIIEQTKNTCMSKYGVPSVMHVEQYKQKLKNTFLERFGVNNPSLSEDIKRKRSQTFIDKYGADNPFKIEQFLEKAYQTRTQNSSLKISKPQVRCGDIIKQIYPDVVFDHREYKYTLDYLLNINGCKIDIEYDGWYWHAFDKQKIRDEKRNEFLISKGYKIIRIRSGELVPTQSQIKEAVNQLINTNKNLIEIYLSDWKEI